MRGAMSPQILGMIGLVVMGAVLPVWAQQTAPPPSGKDLAGKKLFLQRCSICHMPPLGPPGEEGESYGPKLKGLVKDTPTETRAREFIRNGSPRMPGFQYGLTPEEIENIIAYLRVFK